MRRRAFLPMAAVGVLLAERASAETLQAPVGGKAIPLGERVVCGAPAGGWTVEREGRSVKPPPNDDAIGKAIEIKVAPVASACSAATPVTLISTGRFPQIDPASLVVQVDAGRAELRGKRLKGMRLVAEGAGVRSDDVCQEPRVEGGNEVCAFAVHRKLPASPTALAMRWFPPGGSGDEHAATFDGEGRRMTEAELGLKPARIVLATLSPSGANLDVSRGVAKLPLVHPEAVTTVDCAPAFCEVEQGGVVVRGVTQTAATLRARLRLLPRVFVQTKDALDAAPLVEVPILRCPMTIESGAPFRDVDDAHAVVKLEGRCAEDEKANVRSTNRLMAAFDPFLPLARWLQSTQSVH